MKKLLCIVGGMNAGGAETFLMKIFRTLDRTQYQMDFCVAITYRGTYDDEIEQNGGVIHHIPPKTKNPFSSFGAIRRIVKENGYEAVLRISQNSMSCIDLIAAKFGGAKTLAFRSSNSGTCGTRFEDLAHLLFKPVLNMVANIKIAPSVMAGEFMFGKKAVQSSKVKIINNGLDIEQFCFDPKIRDAYRKTLNINSKYAIGHIGRFNSQKNHIFIIDFFEKYSMINPNAILILVGEGETRENVKKECRLRNIQEKVLFLGVRPDVSNIMMALDVLVLPSLFEGMPNVAIEAQTTGLQCLLSSNITREAKVSDLVEFLPIDNTDKWVNALQKGSKSVTNNREQYAVILMDKGYSIHDVRDNFMNLIFGRKK